MKSRKSATKHSVAHSNQRSAVHEIDVEKNQKLRVQQKENQKEPREFVPKDEEPVFRSNISGLGGGKCFRIQEGRLVEMEGNAWEDALWKNALDLNWYHQAQTRKAKSGTITELKRRKVKDRVKLGLRDKHARAQTDMMRETIDLRPDHSRVIQYMLEAGMQDEACAVVDVARTVKIQLFEKIYGRQVLYSAEHDDSGQHHDDLWHSGVVECPDEMIKGRENGKRVMRPRRNRVPFRNYGIGVGAASWGRHFAALRDAGFGEAEMQEFAGPTMEAVKEDTEQVRERYECRPRDARLLAVLDRLVHRKLQQLAPEILTRANGEYAAFLEENYRAGKIGVIASKRKQIRSLEQKLASERQRSERLERAAAEAGRRADNVEMEAFAALDHLKPAEGETLGDAARRVADEREHWKNRFDRVVDHLAAFLTLLISAKIMPLIQRGPAELRRTLGNLMEAVGLKFEGPVEGSVGPAPDLSASAIEPLNASISGDPAPKEPPGGAGKI